MPGYTNDALKRFLNAERQGRVVDADRALVSVLRDLPLASPSAGFADRVLARTGLARAERTVPWWERVAAVACLALGAVGLVVFVPIVIGTLQLIEPAGLVHGVVRAFEVVTASVAELRPFWDLMTRMREALVTLVAMPQVRTALVLCLLASCLALRGLTELLSPQRSPIHGTA